METTPLQKKRAKDDSKDLRKEILILKINNALKRKRRLSLQDLDSRISKNPKTNTRELASSLECSPMTVSRGLKKLGMKKKLSQWIPHSLNSAQKEKRVQICNTLLERHKIKCHLSIFTFF